MKKSDLFFDYPPELIADQPVRPSRVMWVKNGDPRELSFKDFLNQFTADDLIVFNDTKVVPSRVWAKSDGEPAADLLFLQSIGERSWEVLAPVRRMKGRKWILPDEVEILEISSGLPQRVRLSKSIGPEYFNKYGEAPLPPYILKRRGDRHSTPEDRHWYQSIFAKNEGSRAAPTASLHFSETDFDFLKSRGVGFASLTLHVGLGTFVPVVADDLTQHQMHKEWVQIPHETIDKIHRSRGRVFALGTTTARALESVASNRLKESEGGFFGETDLMILPGHDFKFVDALLTNFHQPESTLLALVASFAGLSTVRSCYQWAIDRRFRLFSYGDLSVWEQ